MFRFAFCISFVEFSILLEDLTNFHSKLVVMKNCMLKV